MKRFFLCVILCCAVLVGCGSAGVSQEEYDEVVAELEEAQKQIESEKNQVVDFFNDISGVNVSESGDSKNKALIITCYVELYTESEQMYKIAESIGGKIREAQKEDWFNYDYILIDFWSGTIGRIVSMTVDVNNLSEHMQINEWYGENRENKQQDEIRETEKEQTQENEQKQEPVLIYEDDKVKISFAEITDKGVSFWVENLTDINITVQADSVAINGISTNDILMSDDVAPKSKGKVVARCDDFSIDTKVEKIGGQLRIVDFTNSLKSYDATFSDVSIE